MSDGPKAGVKPQYFSDPAVDTLYRMVLTLGEEVAALREIVDAGFALQADGKSATPEAIAAYEPPVGYDERRAAFVRRLLAPVDALMDGES